MQPPQLPKWGQGAVLSPAAFSRTSTRVPSALPRRFLLTRRRILEAPETIWQRTERVQGTFDRKVTLQADGELYEGLPFDVRVVHDCLRMYR